MTEQTSSGPTGGGTSDDEFDRLIEEAKLPSRPVSLCLDAELRDEYEAVKARITERADAAAAARTAAAAAALNTTDTRLGTKTPQAPPVEERDPEQDRLDELAEQMRAKSVTFIVQAIPSEVYAQLIERHPPRKDPSTGRLDPRDYHGFNLSTFPPVLVRRSIVKPTMTDARWASLNAKINNAQFERLFDAAADVNRRDEDLPF